MKLRSLKIKDASYMLEWMHDKYVVKYMKADFAQKTIEDCRTFIINERSNTNNLHMAIVDDADEYMGTVSLKNVHDLSAEFAIVIRRCAMGKGYSLFGMREILRIGFEELNLKEIYWCVDPENQRAVRFYEKNCYKKCLFPWFVRGYTEEEKDKYYWYFVTGNQNSFQCRM